MKQLEQYRLIQMVSQIMVFVARCFLIPAVLLLQFVVITRYSPRRLFSAQRLRPTSGVSVMLPVVVSG